MRNPRTADAFDTHYERLVDVARSEGCPTFKAACDRFSLVADPDGAEQDADDDHAAREVHLSQSIRGMWFGRITLDPVSGTILDTTLRTIERELFDALTEMATRARTNPPGGRRPAPLFTVIVDLDTLTGPILELYNRTMITPGTAAAHLTDAHIERVVFDTPSRVIDVGTQRRFFTGALRRAIEIRDRTCFHPTCDEIPQHPEIDHIHQHAHGGPTTQTNGRLGCAFHNRWRNHHPDHPTSSDDDDPDP